MALLHASCAAREGEGVLLLGPSGAGKSGLLLRLLDRGFALVADDQVEICLEAGAAYGSAPAALAGLLEVRGLGLVRLPAQERARLRLAIGLRPPERLPAPQHFPDLDLPMLYVEPHAPGAAQIVALALDCVLGRIELVAGGLA